VVRVFGSKVIGSANTAHFRVRLRSPSPQGQAGAFSREAIRVARLRKIYLGGKLLDLPHRFEEEVDYLVSTNHRLVMETITRFEVEDVARAEHEDIMEIRAYNDELRKAANNLALVGLVTRLHHWLSIFVEEITKKSARDNSLDKNLKTLKESTGEGPIDISFFQELVAVRDSIIHADSKSAWMYGNKPRQVASRYTDVSLGEVAFTPAHLQEAIEKSIQQVKWYDERLEALNLIENKEEGNGAGHRT
jgi:hypothetical protein